MILIVGDDPIFLERAREILNRQRRVFFARNSQQAYQLAQDLGFSVVLIDLGLRGDDSLKLIREIHKRFPGLPIIVIGGSPQEAAGTWAEEPGVVEVLHKPVTPKWKPVVERVRALAERA